MENEEKKMLIEIREMLGNGKAHDALEMCNKLIESIGEEENNTSLLEQLYYLRGSAYHRTGDVRNAMNSYLESMERNPNGPAKLAYNNIIQILDFYNHDLYNP